MFGPSRGFERCLCGNTIESRDVGASFGESCLFLLSGFNENNELSKLGNINFFVNSTNYNYVEMTHHIILVSIVDVFAKNIL